MDSVERFRVALRHGTPDRVPTFFRRTGDASGALTAEQTAFIESVADVGEYLNMLGDGPRGEGDVRFDELGIGYKQQGPYTEIVHHPLSEVEEPEELNDYPWPDVSDPSRVAHLRDTALLIRARKKAVAVMGSWGGSTGIFELSWYMRGLENFLCDLVMNRPLAEKLMDIQLELHKKRWSAILKEVGDLADVVCTGDDLGTQTGPLISPALYRALIKPRQRSLIAHIKSLTNAPVYFHSCGAVGAFVPDFIEMGVEVLDPVQPGCLDFSWLKRTYGDALTFYGGVDVQHTLPNGTPGDVRAEVRLRFEQLGGGGGLVLGPSHWMQPDVPWENIRAMYEAILDCAY